MNNLDVLTKKYWTRFAITALVNAGVFVAYRLYIHQLHKKDNQEDAKEKKED